MIQIRAQIVRSIQISELDDCIGRWQQVDDIYSLQFRRDNQIRPVHYHICQMYESVSVAVDCRQHEYSLDRRQRDD